MTGKSSGPASTRPASLAEERFRVAVEGSPSGILLADRTGRIVLVNRQVEALFGYRREELVGESVEKLVPGRFRAAHAQLREGFFGAPETRPMGAGRDLWGVRKDGREFPVEIGLNPLETEEGPMVLASIIDISRQRAMERQLLQTEKLTALGQLSAGVAHEINTPLANITLVAESVRRRSTDDWVQRRMETVVSQVESCARIVKGLLDFARQQEPKIRPVNAGDAVRQAIEFVRAKVSPDVRFEANGVDDGIWVLADEFQLRQVLTNLFLNASEAMEGRGSIRVSVRHEPSPGRDPPANEVVFDVEDSGPGIPLEVLPHLFEPFYTTKSDRGGTGLGLSVVHGIVQSFGGRIVATNGAVAGARFRVHLTSVGSPTPPRTP